MKDQILNGYIENFKKAHALDQLDDSEVFEHFVNFCVVSKQYPREFEFSSLHVGGSDDIGLDGAAFIVNGNITQAKEDIPFFLDKNGYLSVSFAFIQTKKSPRFNGDQVGNLIFGIKSFFDSEPAIPENNSVKNLRQIKDEIYRSSLNLHEAPALDLYFVTTGEWKEPEQITGRVRRELRELEKSSLFSSIKFHFYDAEKLKQSYREINRKTIKEIEFSNHVSLPEMPGARQAWIGSIRAIDYVRLITDSDGGLQKHLFEDNVRDFQGANKVNEGIRNTIRNNKEQGALPVFNNGITLIAKKVDLINKKAKLTDFQIVNGCQTSYMLFEESKKLSDETHIVIKIIETTDYEFATKVVKATNRQTEVRDEAFESLSQFHRDLEEFYKAKSSAIKTPIYYERRSKQYGGEPSVSSSQIVTLPTQIGAYVAAHLAQPQSTHRYYGELLNSNRQRMFKPGDNFESYYIPALILKRAESLFKKEMINGDLRQLRYHVVYLVYQYYILKVKATSGYGYEDVISELDDAEKYTLILQAAAASITKCMQLLRLSGHEAARSKTFTDKIREELDLR
ncbi:AIPR family protein [Pseudomonas oryzihabitans]|uniref:AIPR family protein n=1 Tax=Pseudomonas oryzihabitans TaxID=47885 RepID=UPI00165D7C4B|nr:AIPR family protein [Pseudomonas psychrotolerans]